MAAIITREVSGTNATVKNAPLLNTEIDNNFIGINNAVKSLEDNSFVSQKGAANGLATLDDNQKLVTTQLNTNLNAISNLTTTGLIERTGTGTAAIVSITQFGKDLLDDTSVAAQRTTLGLGTAATTAATDYAVASKGVTGGDSHNHSSGGAGQIAYSSLSNPPTLGSAAAMSGPTGTIVETSDTQTLTNKTLTAPKLTENVFTITDAASVSLDPANGGIQMWSLGASRTATASDFTAGYSMLLMVDGNGYTITWPTMTWIDSQPALDSTKETCIELWKTSTTLYGCLVGVA